MDGCQEKVGCQVSFITEGYSYNVPWNEETGHHQLCFKRTCSELNDNVSSKSISCNPNRQGECIRGRGLWDD